MIAAVIMAGGRGERFWPASREDRPKQLLSLGGSASLLQSTVRRVEPLVGVENLFVVTSASLAPEIRRHLPHLPPFNLIIEPYAKNTAPCIALAVAHLRRLGWRDADVMVVLPADHAIRDEKRFRLILAAGCRLIERLGKQPVLVTIGIEPDRPETGYGYIEKGEPLSPAGHAGIEGGLGDVPVWRVARFVEKPDAERAAQYIESGRYLWNSGMFLWRLDAIETAFKEHLPEVGEHLPTLRLNVAWGGGKTLSRLAALYDQMPTISIDVGVMERASEIYCLPGDFGWNDLGSWASVEEALGTDADGNALAADCVVVNSRRCVVFSDQSQRLIATVGLEDIVVVDTPDAVLVCHKDHAQHVREVVDRLRREGRTELLRSGFSFGPPLALTT